MCRARLVTPSTVVDADPAGLLPHPDAASVTGWCSWQAAGGFRIASGRVQVHLLDATYELFRMYFGVPSLRSPDGREVGAVHGLISTTLALLREGGVTHLAAASDQVIRSFRNELFPGYKTEAGVPQELLDQFLLAERALGAIGVVVWPMVYYEADDAIASATARYVDAAERVVILSPDKDMAQCVSGRKVVLFDRRRGLTIDEEAVHAKFGVGPASIPDYLALVGDAADGLPGVPAWGPKSSSALLAAYRHLEAIPLRADRWRVNVRSAERLAASLRDRLAQALMYRYLATLRREVPILEDPDDLEWQGVPRGEFLELCEKLGFEELRSRPHRWH